MEKICVAVRLRPPVNEKTSNWKVEDNRISLHRSLGSPVSGQSYAFDHVFDQDCKNSRVYELLTKDIIHSAVQGFNGTAFAYGQTSSGKTFTMNGSDSDPGIILQAVKDIFRNIKMTTDREFLVRISYMEIYNEEINDLFSVESTKLQIHESLERGIFVAGLKEEIVNSAEQVLELIQSGEVNRHFGETNMNVRSSRSHTIFRMVIESKGKETCSSLDDAIRVSVLNLVDLAGSERIAKTGAGGVRLKEGKYINKSLMVLGNVINKLSEGTKQRGHIPYRDSKLTRILQPALGGNAKTSIICTLAPEEVHIEETKGTLQFASRAKRITNRVQVNEILTDAALLKRQKLEIEELRNKLQGSHAEVLEQEILKLRNDMLKYEQEREKLATELEEERKSQRERDQALKVKQAQEFVRKNLKEESSNNHSTSSEDAFRTPCFKAVPNTFVVKRSHQSRQSEFSPLPDTFSSIADEDTWEKMNKGFVADLDSLHLTPPSKDQSFQSTDVTSGLSAENYEVQIQHLQRQLKLATEERDGYKRHHEEQILMNNRLVEEVSELQQEALLIQETPRMLCDSVSYCKDIYKDVLSIFQNLVADEKSSTAKLLSSTCEIGTCLLTTLETHFAVAVDSHEMSTSKNLPIQQQCNMLSQRFVSTITSLVSSEAPTVEHELMKDTINSSRNKVAAWSLLPRCHRPNLMLLFILILGYHLSSLGCTLGGEIACWKEKLGNEVGLIMEKYQSLEKKLDANNQLLEVSKERYRSLENEFHRLLEERDSLLQTVSSSSKRVALLTHQKEKVLQDLNTEIKRRKDVEEEIKEFSAAFSCRQRSLLSFYTEFKSKVEDLKAQNSTPKALGY